MQGGGVHTVTEAASDDMSHYLTYIGVKYRAQWGRPVLAVGASYVACWHALKAEGHLPAAVCLNVTCYTLVSEHHIPQAVTHAPLPQASA